MTCCDPMILLPPSCTIRGLPDAKPVWFAAGNVSLSVMLAVKLFKIGAHDEHSPIRGSAHAKFKLM
jgi:hypothetical protein